MDLDLIKNDVSTHLLCLSLHGCHSSGLAGATKKIENNLILYNHSLQHLAVNCLFCLDPIATDDRDKENNECRTG